MENVFSIHQQSTRVIVSMETAQMAFTKVGFPKFCQTSTNLWNHHRKLFSENQRRILLAEKRMLNAIVWHCQQKLMLIPPLYKLSTNFWIFQHKHLVFVIRCFFFHLWDWTYHVKYVYRMRRKKPCLLCLRISYQNSHVIRRIFWCNVGLQPEESLMFSVFLFICFQELV